MSKSKQEQPTEVQGIMEALAKHFPQEEVKFKPGAVNGNRAMALAYVDARAIQDRLDEVLGIDGWTDEYELLPGGSVLCKLRCRIGEQWLVKSDVGSQSEQHDAGDRLKSAFSDALKRAAVKYGVGRYLYRLPAAWVDYNPATKRLVWTPKLEGPAPAKEATITDEERQHLTELLHRKGKTPGAALKTAGCHGAELADLTAEQYRRLLEKLEGLPDVAAVKK